MCCQTPTPNPMSRWDCCCKFNNYTSVIFCGDWAPINGQPLLQVLADLIDVSDLLCVQAEELAMTLEPRAASRLGSTPGKPAIMSSNGNPISTLHAPPLQTPWQAALAAGLQTMLPWLDHLPCDADIADKLYTAATRLASSAANALQAAAEGADPAATLEQPSALALAEALLAYLDVDIQHVEGALLRGCTRPDTTDSVMGTLRAVAAALKALTLAMVSSVQHLL